jgi:hypothetical protein
MECKCLQPPSGMFMSYHGKPFNTSCSCDCLYPPMELCHCSDALMAPFLIQIFALLRICQALTFTTQQLKHNVKHDLLSHTLPEHCSDSDAQAKIQHNCHLHRCFKQFC